MSDQGLWEWAVAAYATPGVAAACLQLQDVNAQNVPLLLWAAWCAKSARRPDADALEAACDTARAWEHAAIVPLRKVRTTLKAQILDMNAEARLALREQVKVVELAAERGLLADLEALSPSIAGTVRPALDGMAEVARVWDRVVPRQALIALAERLPA
ncbi:TIGR02444 family protein [Brevundimonas sp.]|uniref:TIGR02444 family protein n=1 Tax=Brevundimonas sp. TaxID=1871086 RepID=UPI001A34AEDB|nr:TIGR02444 family protein [Brevundimonas sp.]MBJ7485934.1 TIGR02444 family protein [Brevundimonas sp.]